MKRFILLILLALLVSCKQPQDVVLELDEGTINYNMFTKETQDPYDFCGDVIIGDLSYGNNPDRRVKYNAATKELEVKIACTIKYNYRYVLASNSPLFVTREEYRVGDAYIRLDYYTVMYTFGRRHEKYYYVYTASCVETEEEKERILQQLDNEDYVKELILKEYSKQFTVQKVLTDQQLFEIASILQKGHLTAETYLSYQ